MISWFLQTQVNVGPIPGVRPPQQRLRSAKQKVKRLVDCRIYDKEFFIVNSAVYQPFNFLCCFTLSMQHPIFI